MWPRIAGRIGGSTAASTFSVENAASVAANRRGIEAPVPSAAMSEIVTYEADGRVAVITLNRPEARNAVNGDVAAGVEAAIDRLEADDDVWVGILRRQHRGPGAPGVLRRRRPQGRSTPARAALGTERGGFAGFVYRERRKPIIVAVDGLATAGGCEIVLAADLVVATTRSSFGLAEVKRNLVAGAGGLFRLPRAIGQAAAMEAILTGEPIPAERAYALGLVSRLVEPGEAARRGPPAGRPDHRCCAPLAVWESRAVVRAAADEDDETLKRMTEQGDRAW